MNNPDVWVIVELSGTKVKDRYYRVLAGWYGGYTGGDSWKMSSGITKIIDKDKFWEIHNESGSIYNCYKDIERFSGQTRNIYQSYQKDNTDEVTIKHIPIQQCLNNLKT